MLTIDHAHHLVRRAVIADSLRTGQPWRAWIEEFDGGWIYWTTPPATEHPAPVGTGNKSLLDKHTGEVSHWPALPTDNVIASYRSRMPVRPPQAPRTVDPVAALIADRRIVDAPTTLVRVTDPSGGVRDTVGAKTDVDPRPHPLLEQWLDDQPAGILERGAARQAELIALSDLLYELDWTAQADGAQPIDPAGVRQRLRPYRTAVHAIRPHGHPDHGKPRMPSHTGIRAWAWFGLARQATLDLIAPHQPETVEHQPVPEPGRFPPDIEAILASAGWGDTPTPASAAALDPQTWSRTALDILGEAVDGRHRIPPLPAAQQVIADFPRLDVELVRQGEDTWVVPFTIGVTRHLARYADVLGDVAQVIGEPLAPIGQDRSGGVIAVAAGGRVYVLDQTGEYHYGDDIDSALTALIRGTTPTRVTW